MRLVLVAFHLYSDVCVFFLNFLNVARELTLPAKLLMEWVGEMMSAYVKLCIRQTHGSACKIDILSCIDSQPFGLSTVKGAH